MAYSSAILTMQNAIISYINAHIPKDPNQAHIGTINGNRVVIANKSYAYDPAVDIFFQNGDKVYCLLPNGSNIAAIVGVA